MELQYRTATQDEIDHLKCNALAHNKIQCAHKVSKLAITDEYPTQLDLVNVKLNYCFYLCECHFNVLTHRMIAEKENPNIIINLEEKENGNKE